MARFLAEFAMPAVLLAAMTMNSSGSLPGSGPYRITVHILRPGSSGVIEADFVFRHARA